MPTPSSKSALNAENMQKFKIIGLITLTAILVIFAGYNLVKLLAPPPQARQPQSAEWDMAREVNEALVARPAFHDASLTVDPENPKKFKVMGQVKTGADLAALKAFIKETKPEITDDQLDFSEFVTLRP